MNTALDLEKRIARLNDMQGMATTKEQINNTSSQIEAFQKQVDEIYGLLGNYGEAPIEIQAPKMREQFAVLRGGKL